VSNVRVVRGVCLPFVVVGVGVGVLVYNRDSGVVLDVQRLAEFRVCPLQFRSHLLQLLFFQVLDFDQHVAGGIDHGDKMVFYLLVRHHPAAFLAL
jgi:hypothetical protein